MPCWSEAEILLSGQMNPAESGMKYPAKVKIIELQSDSQLGVFPV